MIHYQSTYKFWLESIDGKKVSENSITIAQRTLIDVFIKLVKVLIEKNPEKDCLETLTQRNLPLKFQNAISFLKIYLMVHVKLCT